MFLIIIECDVNNISNATTKTKLTFIMNRIIGKNVYTSLATPTENMNAIKINT